MARYPGASWKPLPEAGQEPLIAATQVILHSAVSNSPTLYPYFSRADVVLESHFYVNQSTVEQYVDTSRQADANRTANVRAISIETWDAGDPDRNPWTPRQLDLLTQLVAWCCRVHRIPARQCPGPHDSGIGWHVMFGAPGPWTPVAKSCPGRARIPQVPNLIRRVQALLRKETEVPDLDLKEIARGVELAVKSGGVARDDFKSLVIGSFLDGIREDGDIRGELIEVIQEAVKPLLAQLEPPKE